MKKSNPRLIVQPETMQKIIAHARDEYRIFFKRAKKENETTTGSCFIVDGPAKIRVLTEYNGKTMEYITYKDGREVLEGEVEGGDCYRIMARHYWKPQIETPQIELSASPTLGYNPKYNETRQYAYSYDLNSAYDYQILQGWIDELSGPVAKIIEDGEVGFDNDLSHFMLPGEYSLFVFKKCDTPEGLVRFVNEYYKRKRNAKTKLDKKNAKNMLTHPVGYLQLKNPFLRAYVVASCNEFIENLLDENSLLWNTDCIVSRTRRYDLEENLGDNIGQWKIENEGMFAYVGLTYQWGEEKPAWRAVPKDWIPDKYDILDPNAPAIVSRNVWYMDWDNLNFVNREEQNNESW